MDERMRFVIRHKDGGGIASLCCEFEVSGKTGYKRNAAWKASA
jgi:hypothetical protein